MKKIINTLKEKAANIDDGSDVWKLHDYLLGHREEILLPPPTHPVADNTQNS